MEPHAIEEPGWTTAAIGLGSNLGDRAGHLDRAVSEIASLAGVRVLAVSDWIETEPVGGPAGSPRYLNGALILETRLPPQALLDAMLAIERAHGRARDTGRRADPGVRGEPRTLDLDLLVVGGSRIEVEGLALPHPRLEEREFVLIPLAQVAPDLVLGSGRTARERLAEIQGVSP